MGITGADVEKLTAVGLPRPVGRCCEPLARRMEHLICYEKMYWHAVTV